ncbi:E3 ubiquitin-protein ligase DTX4-like isoform X2 [Stegostoma tigrinum]|uniref:E3 ubiquitin-protein ligase DTX4-like isoform X2 n=1 Tax=Stegostoma tigrinum TaxID=3053191 RepID=UPI00286FB3C7|nr:E3 ubiquitin-protein ligase DTX4-like isoform X2 [Stegostoma tigrinum]
MIGDTRARCCSVVWEWLSEHGRWRPYSAAVCHHIEMLLRSTGTAARGGVVLGRLDPRLSPYIIDLQSMHQFRQDTGTLRPVRRNLYDSSSAPGKGIVWEWESDSGAWMPYDMDLSVAIQAAHESHYPWIDLGAAGLPYVLDLASMHQTNLLTHRHRRMRQRLGSAYPLSAPGPCPFLPPDLPPPPRPPPPPPRPGPPCSCKQCLLVASIKASPLVAAGNGAYRAGVRPPQALPVRALAGESLDPRHRLLPPPPPSARTVPTRPQTGSSSSPSTCLTKAVAVDSISASGLQQRAVAQSWALIASGVPTVPVKNLNSSSPVHPALAGMTGILMSAAGLPVCLTRPPKLILHPPPVSKTDIKPIPGISHTSRKSSKRHSRKGHGSTVFTGRTPEEMVQKYLHKVPNPPDEDCTICTERLAAPSGYKCAPSQPAIKPDSVGKLAKCAHSFHVLCLVAMYNNGNKDGSLQCPTCKTIYGVKTGTQPPGKMEYHTIPHSLPGYPDSKTIRIIYNIPPGIQGPDHPHPGMSFTARGFPRHCYLPDNEKGREVLRLLLVAWDRRLIFAIGTSSTTGETDTVVWNEIHHKTEFGSNLTGHGYPDCNYLENVWAELRAQGISDD